MLQPADKVWHAISGEFRRLCSTIPDANTDGSVAQAIGYGLRLLQNREHGGLQFLHGQLDQLDLTLRVIDELLKGAGDAKTSELARLQARLVQARKLQNAVDVEREWRSILTELQSLLSGLNATRAAPRTTRDEITRRLVAWESADLLSQIGPEQSNSGQRPGAVQFNQENFSAYLQDRFQEPGMRLTSLQLLAGGFGKETTVFEVEGRALSGSYVIRRDLGENAGLENDCHQISREYPVIRAARAHGFPAPDAVWLDTEHKLLPGGDFIVMRRSPGKIAGSFFGAQTRLPEGLGDALADILARLHGLPPLVELGDLTDSIRLDLWNLSRRDCIERYIRNWYDYFLGEEHTPSPALVSLYGWLLDNVPNRSGKPVLLHGDVGFNNFLFHEGSLSAVLDWEFAHIGDPAEDIGYVKVTVGESVDWNRLMERYIAAGGAPVDPETLRFFQVWAYVRNASAANVISTRFTTGRAGDLKLAMLPHAHFPHFIRRALALIDASV